MLGLASVVVYEAKPLSKALAYTCQCPSCPTAHSALCTGLVKQR